MQTVLVGKTKIRIHAQGCLDCGTEHSSGWNDAGFVYVTVGPKPLHVGLARCNDCWKAWKCRKKSEKSADKYPRSSALEGS